MSQLTALHSCLILSFLSSCGNNEVLRVIQSPPDITVEEGETADMQCCWGWGSQMEQVKLIWENSTSEIYGQRIDMRSTEYQTTSTNLATEGKYSSSISGNCSDFSISDVSTNDAGVFICSIRGEIPYYIAVKGSGTRLTVKPRPGTDRAPLGNNEVLHVIQYPPDITLEEGETAHMQCCWRLGSQMEQVQLEWKTSTSKIYYHKIDMHSTEYQTISTNLATEGKYGSSISGNCSDFSISDVSTNDAGVFICSIRGEIPHFIYVKGNGTRLTVKPRPGTDRAPLGNNEVLHVIQYPPDITLEEGETAHMQCCWRLGSQMEQVQLEWKTSTSKIYYHKIDMHSTEYQTTSTNLATEGKYGSSISGNCSDFSISDVSTNDAGVFICSIRGEIPHFIYVKGSGTRLTVKPRPGTDRAPLAVEESGASVEEVLIFILRCLPFLALLTAVFCLCRMEAKAADRAPEGSGREEEKEADNEPATSLLEAADAEVVGGRILRPPRD